MSLMVLPYLATYSLPRGEKEKKKKKKRKIGKKEKEVKKLIINPESLKTKTNKTQWSAP